MDDIIQVQLGKRTITLRKPDPMLCMEIGVAASTNMVRAQGAALTACGVRTRTKLADVSYNVLLHGERVWAELIEKGAEPAQIATAGLQAIRLCMDLLPTAEEVDAAAAGFRSGEE